MSAYLIEIDDTKRGVTYPTVVGPFPDAESAAQFAEMTGMGTAAEDGQGGYSAVHVISDARCDSTPESYWQDWQKDAQEYLDDAELQELEEQFSKVRALLDAMRKTEGKTV